MYKYHIFLLSILSGMLGACGNNDIAIDMGSAKACDVAVMSCVISNAGYTLTLQLGPDVKPLSPFTTQLQIESTTDSAQGVVVDFQMVGMDMGLNRYRLIRSNGSWVGKTTLPICTASRTDWNAIVEFVDAGKKYTANFPFHTDVN